MAVIVGSIVLSFIAIVLAYVYGNWIKKRKSAEKISKVIIDANTDVKVDAKSDAKREFKVDAGQKK